MSQKTIQFRAQTAENGTSRNLPAHLRIHGGPEKLFIGVILGLYRDNGK